MTEPNQANPAPGGRGTKDGMIAAGLFLIAGVALGAYIMRSRPGIHIDVERYIYLAYCLRTGDWNNLLHYHYPPGFPALIALMSFFTTNLELAARIAGYLGTAATTVPVYFLARSCFGRRSAILAALLYGCRFLPDLSFLGAEQAVMPFLYTGVLVGHWARRDGRARWFFLTGALFGAAFLIKAEAGAYFISYLAILSVTAGRELWQRRAGPEPKIRIARAAPVAVATVAAGYFIFAGPYLGCYYRDTGLISFNPKAKTLFFIHNFYYHYQLMYKIHQDERGLFTPAQRIIIEGDKIPNRESMLQKLWMERATFPDLYLKRTVVSARFNLAGFYFQKMAPWIWPALLIFGLAPAAGKKRRWTGLYLHSFAVLPLLLVPLFNHTFPRFYLTLVPWFMIVLGRGLDRTIAVGETKFPAWTRFRSWAGPATAVMIVLSGARQIITAPIDVPYWNRVENRLRAAIALKQMLPPDCRFMAELSNPSIWYLASEPPPRMEIIPTASIPEVINFAAAKNARFIVYYESEFRNRYNRLDPLLEPGFSAPGLNERLRYTGSDGRVYVIYEVLATRCGPDAPENFSP